MFGAKKEEKVLQLMADHLHHACQCLATSKSLFDRYLENNPDECEKLWLEVQRLEHQADIIRRDIYELLGQGAFLPILRADLHHFVDLIDDVAGEGEDLTDIMICEHPIFPKAIIPNLQNISNKTLWQMEEMAKVVQLFLRDHHSAQETIHQGIQLVLATEHEIDELEHELTRAIFRMSLPLAEKLHLKRILTQLAEISNRIEDVADLLGEIIVKMQA